MNNPKHYYLYGSLAVNIGAAIVIALWRNADNAHLYTSHIAATNIASYFILLVSVLLQLIFTILFIRKYLFKHIDANRLFIVSYYCALFCFLTVAIFPMVSGFSSKIHELFATLSFFISLFIYAQLIMNNKIKTIIKLTIITTIFIGISLQNRLLPIVWQGLLVVLGQLNILLVAYSPVKTVKTT